MTRIVVSPYGGAIELYRPIEFVFVEVSEHERRARSAEPNDPMPRLYNRKTGKRRYARRRPS